MFMTSHPHLLAAIYDLGLRPSGGVHNWQVAQTGLPGCFALAREHDLASEIASGTALADAFQLELFLMKRNKDLKADFNTHLKQIGRAI